MRPIRRCLLRCLAASALALASLGVSAAQSCAWPDWDAFRRGTLSSDGRVIDASTPQQVTVSEGEAYALFFALVADDRATFEKVLTWTRNNLAQGDLATHLPAWIWGRRGSAAAASGSAARPDDKVWGVIDENPASDADVWMVYALLEAGRLWNEPRYAAIGAAMARNVLSRETAVLPGLGRTLLPGPVGFQLANDRWRLNPSYVPLQVMRRVAQALPDQPEWNAMVDTSTRLVADTAPLGFSPDWVEYRTDHGFEPDEQSHAQSAYDAIRVYLWAGMLAPDEPMRARVLDTFRPLADFIATHGYPPERVDTRTGAPGPNAGNVGYSAAVAPYLIALGRSDPGNTQVKRSRMLAQQTPPDYYSQVLMLFGLGYLQGLYRFDADGRVLPAWTSTCPATH
jgi:endoglucanase